MEIDKTKGKRLRNAGVVGILLVLVVGLSGLFIWLVRPVAEPTPIVSYSLENMNRWYGSNSGGVHVVDTFEQVSDNANNALRSHKGLSKDLVDDGGIDRFIADQQVRAGGPDRDVMLFTLTLNGVVDEEGVPYALPYKQSPFYSSDWIPVARLLQQIDEACSKRNQNPVVFIDSSRVDSIAQPRLLIDRFPTAVENLFASGGPFAESNIKVVLSHGTGQRSWFAPELGRTVFTEFIARGLSGSADGRGSNGKEDDQVTLLELVDYLQEEVDDWVAGHRGRRQIPIVIPDNPADMSLIYCNGTDGSELQSDPTIAQVRTRSEQAQSQWNALFADPARLALVRRYRPLQLAQLESLLIRLEMLVPFECDGEFEWVKRESDKLMTFLFDIPEELQLPDPNERLQEASQTIEARFISLGEAEYWRALPTAKLDNPDNKTVDLPTWIDVQESTDEKRDEMIADLRKNLVDVSYCERYELWWLVWNWLRQVDGGPSAEQLAYAVEMFDEHYRFNASKVDPPGREWSEIYFLRLLNQYVDWESADDPGTISASIQAAMEGRASAEQFQASVDRRSLFWLQADLEQIEDDRRQAEDLIYVGKFEDAKEILDAIPGRFNQLTEHSDQIAELLDLRVQAMHDLPFLLVWEFRRLAGGAVEIERKPVEDLTRLMHDFDQLGSQLYRAAQYTNKTAVLEIQINDYRRPYQQAIARFYDEWTEVSESVSNSPADLDTIQNLLLCPLPDDARRRLTRADLRSRYLTILESSSGSLDSSSGSQTDASQNATSLDVDLAKFEQLLGEWERALNPEMTVSILNVQERLEQLCEATHVDSWGSDTSGISVGFANLRRDWLGPESNRGDRQDRVARLVGMDHVARRISPFLAFHLAEQGGSNAQQRPDTDVSLRMAQVLKENSNLSRANQFVLDFWGNGAVSGEVSIPGGTPYFASTASLLMSRQPNLDSEDRTQTRRNLRDHEDAATRMRSSGRRWIIPPSEVVTFEPDPESRVSHTLQIEIEQGLPVGHMGLSLLRSGKLVPVKEPLVEGSESSIRHFDVVVERTDEPTEVVLNYEIPITPQMISDDANQSRSRQFIGELFFRGHQTRNSFALIENEPPEATFDIAYNFQPVSNSQSTVTLQGGADAIVDVVIIVDCSASMARQVRFAEGGAQMKRMEAVNLILTDLVDRFKEQTETRVASYRIGMVALGHRAAISREQDSNRPGTEVDWNVGSWGNAAITAAQEEGISFYNDVEVIFSLPAGPAADEIGDFNEKLDFLDSGKLVHWGETPMYEAIKLAASELNRNASQESSKHILLLTDGTNNPGAGEDFPITEIATRRIAEIDGRSIENWVLKPEVAKTEILVHPILYDVTPDDIEDRDKRRQVERGKSELEGLSRGTGAGDPIDEKSGEAIVEALGEFNQKTFWIRPAESSVAVEPHIFTRDWVQLIDSPGDYTLTTSLDPTTPFSMYLYGGEKVGVDLSGRNNFTIQDDVGLVFSQSKTATFGDLRHTFNLLGGNRESLRYAFRFGILSSRHRTLHTDRPGFVVLDVQANGTVENGANIYRVCDFNYLPGRSFPIVRFAEIPIDPDASYTLTLHAVPRQESDPIYGTLPTNFIRNKPVEEISPEEGWSFNHDGVQFDLTRSVDASGAQELQVEVTASSGEQLKEYLVVCPVSTSTRRLLNTSGTKATHRFSINASASGSEAAKIQIFRMEELFSAANGAITTQFTFDPR